MSFSVNLFLVGAPKCGTTALARYLSQFKDVFVPEQKEPHYFNTDLHVYARNLNAYHGFYRGYAGERYLLDGSVFYLYSDVAIDNVLEYNPEARFIVMVRDPVAMAASLHNQLLFTGTEDEPDFETAWRLQEHRQQGGLVSRLATHSRYLLYGEVCSLGKQVERLTERVSWDRLLVLATSDLRDKGFVDEGIHRLLGIQPPAAEIPHANESKMRRSRSLMAVTRVLSRARRRLNVPTGLGILNTLNDLNEKPFARPALRPEFETELRDYFRHDVRTLERVTGRSYAWGEQ